MRGACRWSARSSRWCGATDGESQWARVPEHDVGREPLQPGDQAQGPVGAPERNCNAVDERSGQRQRDHIHQASFVGCRPVPAERLCCRCHVVETVVLEQAVVVEACQTSDRVEIRASVGQLVDLGSAARDERAADLLQARVRILDVLEDTVAQHGVERAVGDRGAARVAVARAWE